MIGQVWRRLTLLVAQGVGRLVSHERVQVTILDDDNPPRVDRIEPYGFSYRPKPGCQVFMVFPNGDRSHGIALVIGDKQYNMELTEGEVAIHDDEGNHVHIQRGGIIEAKAYTKVLATTPLFETTKDALIGGDLHVKGNTLTEGGNTANAGFYGEGGGAAECKSGLKVLNGADFEGPVKANGHHIDETHKHTSELPGDPTSEVIT